MKSERRHELQTNIFADWLGKQLESHRHHLKTVAMIGLALVVVGVVYIVVSQRQSAAAGRNWTAYFKAFWKRDPDEMTKELEKVAKDESAVLPGLWARQTEADIDLENGVRQLYRDRDEALRSLDSAERGFAEVDEKAVGYPALSIKARYGLAQALENQGKLEKAREKYDLVAKADPTGALGKLAERRGKAIMSDQVAEFYDWFQRQTPQPLGKPGGSNIPPLNLDNSLDSLSDRPNLSFGTGKDDDKQSADSPEKPDEPNDKPENDKPNDKPSDKPADPAADESGEKPAEKPAEKP